MLQLRYARLAQGLNPDRGTPYLAEALITNQMGGGADDPGSAARSLHTWRRAMSADPWNTHGFWSFREFLLANPGVADQLRADERPATLVDRMLELDPVFIPAIEATLMDIGVDSSPRTRTKQAEFLDRHLDGRMHWMARENREAAIAYAGFLAAYAPAPDRQEYWQQVGREVEAIQPLVEKRLLF